MQALSLLSIVPLIGIVIGGLVQIVNEMHGNTAPNIKW
jgi:hypothetical protein